MSQTLGGWNRKIFLGQVALLAVVVAVSYVTRAGVQAAVLIGLGSFVVLTALHAIGAMKQEREIVLDLSISNACGIVSSLFFVATIINNDSASANIAAVCLIVGMTFLCTAFSMTISVARTARALGARGQMQTLVLVAAPLGIGPLYEWVMQRSGRTVGSL